MLRKFLRESITIPSFCSVQLRSSSLRASNPNINLSNFPYFLLRLISLIFSPINVAIFSFEGFEKMSGAPLDMSLDDLIKQNKKAGGNGRGRGRAGGPGPARRFPNRTSNRAAPYSTKAPESTWQHDMYGADGYSGPSAAGQTGSIETGTKLYISNLDYGVSNEDVKELFSEVGDLKRCAVHYDRSGRSKGTAEVVFSRRQDAIAGVKRYNNVQLDGKPMKIEIVGTNISTPGAIGGPVNGSFGNSNGMVQRSGQGRGRFGRSRGGGGRGRGFGRGGGRGRGRGRDEKVSAEDLDADLEKYHSESMDTN